MKVGTTRSPCRYDVGADNLSDRQIAAARRQSDRHLAETLKRCLARTAGERFPGLVSFSSPVFDAAGNVILAFTSFGMRTNFAREWGAELPRALRDHAFELTQVISA